MTSKFKHLNRKFECPDCNLDCPDFKVLGTHIRYKHGKQMVKQCHICDKIVRRADELIKHYLNIHLKEIKRKKETDVDNWSCRFCTESFGKKQLLKRHLMVKHLNGKFECPFMWTPPMPSPAMLTPKPAACYCSWPFEP